jgi:hypothetical protein
MPPPDRRTRVTVLVALAANIVVVKTAGGLLLLPVVDR